MGKLVPNEGLGGVFLPDSDAQRVLYEEFLFTVTTTVNGYPPQWISASQDVKRCIRAAESLKTSPFIFKQLGTYRKEKTVREALLANPAVPEDLKVLWAFEWGKV